METSICDGAYSTYVDLRPWYAGAYQLHRVRLPEIQQAALNRIPRFCEILRNFLGNFVGIRPGRRTDESMNVARFRIVSAIELRQRRTDGIVKRTGPSGMNESAGLSDGIEQPDRYAVGHRNAEGQAWNVRYDSVCFGKCFETRNDTPPPIGIDRPGHRDAMHLSRQY